MPIAQGNNRTALITGATGFIGQHLVDALLLRDWQITALVLQGEEPPAHWINKVKLVVGDIRTLASLEQQVGDIDTVFHLAAIVSDWGATSEHIDITVNGTRQAITLALKKHAHFVVTTSIAAYASNLGRGLINENMPHGKPSSAYERCKQQQEQVTLDAVAFHQLQATLIRPGNVYGVGSKPWVERLSTLIKSGSPVILGKGDWDAGLCHVDNLIQLMILAATRAHPNGQIYNAADGFGVTWIQYITHLTQALGLPKAKHVPRGIAQYSAPILEAIAHLTKRKEPPVLTRLAYRLMGENSIFSIGKAKYQLGYRPVTTFEQAMSQLAQVHLSSIEDKPTVDRSK
ncbi:MAG: NAD-dependent epimerase/dehydratase family protein [Moritella sp.]|uniref:NAD-dependent epimerase/dehydratase family protein n=1 Tax=Moritella sp. TaxID=78556 RepID=UPI0025F41CA9|nr:NAD-dependent epimerase/dehydratase family protein [Moritella sp.]NQZ93255.1 NAD-dependent epimerase/dehydratase family protein [Moritella sp.]